MFPPLIGAERIAGPASQWGLAEECTPLMPNPCQRIAEIEMTALSRTGSWIKVATTSRLETPLSNTAAQRAMKTCIEAPGIGNIPGKSIITEDGGGQCLIAHSVAKWIAKPGIVKRLYRVADICGLE